MEELRLASQRLSFANTEPRMMLGNRRLSKDDWTARLLVTGAMEGNIPAVRKLARRLMRSGKGVEEAMAAVKDRKYSGRGPLRWAAWAGRREMCKFLIKDLRLDVDAPGDDGWRTPAAPPPEPTARGTTTPRPPPPPPATWDAASP